MTHEIPAPRTTGRVTMPIQEGIDEQIRALEIGRAHV